MLVYVYWILIGCYFMLIGKGNQERTKGTEEAFILIGFYVNWILC